MSTINVSCIDQQMAIMNAPIIASGGQNEDEIQFSFSSEWNGFACVCAFWQSGGQYWLSLIDENNICPVPAEAMAKEGKIYFGVVGVKENVKRTSEVISYYIREGVVTEPEEPTPSIYQQILAHVAVADQALEDVQALSEAVEESIEEMNRKIDEMGIDAFERRVEALEQTVPEIGQSVSDLETNQGDLSELETTEKTNLVGAINEAFAEGGKKAYQYFIEIRYQNDSSTSYMDFSFSLITSRDLQNTNDVISYLSEVVASSGQVVSIPINGIYYIGNSTSYPLYQFLLWNVTSLQYKISYVTTDGTQWTIDLDEDKMSVKYLRKIEI